MRVSYAAKLVLRVLLTCVKQMLSVPGPVGRHARNPLWFWFSTLALRPHCTNLGDRRKVTRTGEPSSQISNGPASLLFSYSFEFIQTWESRLGWGAQSKLQGSMAKDPHVYSLIRQALRENSRVETQWRRLGAAPGV